MSWNTGAMIFCGLLVALWLGSELVAWLRRRRITALRELDPVNAWHRRIAQRGANERWGRR